MSDLPVRLDTGAPLSFKKLNIGCGFTRLEGHINIDLQAFHKPDIVGDLRDLSMLPSCNFDEIIAKDVIEHVEWRDTTTVLYEWNRLLETGGRLFIATTYLTGLLRRLLNPKYNSIEKHKTLIINLFSMQKYQGDYHFTAFTERLTRYYLWETGFEIESIDVRDGWLFNVWATKRTDYSFAQLIQSDATDEHFIRTLYRDVLRREPSSQEVALKIKQLSSGATRAKVRVDFLRSDERAIKMTAASPNFQLVFDVA